MALTDTLRKELPLKTAENGESWSVRRLFPLKALTAAFAKVFISSFDVLLGLLVFAAVIVEVTGRTPWGLYLLAILMLAADVFERWLKAQPNKDEHGK